MCLGQNCGIEHAIHALRKAYESPEVEGVLLIDAQNALNSLNRELALKNIDILCPSLSQAIRNSYSTPTDLFINRSTIKSQEGTTQGDPLAMAMYGIAILPLIKRVMSNNVTHKWFADDGNAAGSISSLLKLYHDLKEIGPHFGYKVIKCHLIVKSDFEQRAQDLFANQDVEILKGHRVLGSVIGNEESCQQFFEEKSQT